MSNHIVLYHIIVSDIRIYRIIVHHALFIINGMTDIMSYYDIVLLFPLLHITFHSIVLYCCAIVRATASIPCAVMTYSCCRVLSCIVTCSIVADCTILYCTLRCYTHFTFCILMLLYSRQHLVLWCF